MKINLISKVCALIKSYQKLSCMLENWRHHHPGNFTAIACLEMSNKLLSIVPIVVSTHIQTNFSLWKQIDAESCF